MRSFCWVTLVTMAVGLAVATDVRAQPAPFRLVPVFDVGCAMCGGPGEFGEVLAVAVGVAGVAVADRDSPHVRMFSSSGALQGTAGPQGQGPGEMELPLALARRGDGVSVVEQRRPRLINLDAQGRETGATRLDAFPLAASFDSVGALYFAFANFREGTAGVSVLRGGAPRELMAAVDIPGLEVSGAQRMYFSLAAAPGGGFAVGYGQNYRIALFDQDGRLQRQVQRDVPRRPRSSEEMAAERARRSRLPAGVAASPEGSLARPLQVDPHHLHFLLGALQFDGSGRLWVRTERGVGETIFDVFSADMTFVGEVVVPGRVGAFSLGDGQLAAAVLDEWDVATVKVWRVEGTPPS